MEMTVAATHGGRVREVLAAASTHVDAGAPLVIVEPETVGDGMAPETPRIGFGAATAASQPAARLRARGHLDALRSLIMGFDVTAEAAGRLVRDFEQRPRPSCRPTIPSCCTASSRSSRSSPTWPSSRAIGRRRSARISTRTAPTASAARASTSGPTCDSLDVEREGLPETFVARLARALAHYGVHRARAHARARGGGLPDLPRPPARAVAASRRDGAPRPPPPAGRGTARAAARRVPRDARPPHRRGAAPPSGRSASSPAACASGSSTSPSSRRLASGSSPPRGRSCGYLAAHPDAPDRAERIDAMVSSPEPLIRLLAERIGGRDGQAPLLEVLTRRYYKIRDARGPALGAARRPAVPHRPLSARRPPRAADHGRWPRSRSCPSSPRPPSGWPPMPRTCSP